MIKREFFQVVAMSELLYGCTILTLTITEKTVKHEDGGDTSCNWRTWNGPQRLIKGIQELEIVGRIEIIQTTAWLRSAEKSPGDLWRRTVTLTYLKYHQPMLV